MLPVVILAGGLATRLRPITEKIPKSLVEVAGRPFIHWQLDYLARQGVRKVVICTGYLGEQIELSVGNGSDFGLEVIYSPDGPTLLGTGGALRKALKYLGQAFFVLYGDSFLPIEFAAVESSFVESGKPALMTVMRNEGSWDISNVLYSNGRIIVYDKSNPSEDMEYIDYGLGILTEDVLQFYEEGETLDLADIYKTLSVEGHLAGYETKERFYEIGSHSGLSETEIFLSGAK